MILLPCPPPLCSHCTHPHCIKYAFLLVFMAIHISLVRSSEDDRKKAQGGGEGRGFCQLMYGSSLICARQKEVNPQVHTTAFNGHSLLEWGSNVSAFQWLARAPVVNHGAPRLILTTEAKATDFVHLEEGKKEGVSTHLLHGKTGSCLILLVCILE